MTIDAPWLLPVHGVPGFFESSDDNFRIAGLVHNRVAQVQRGANYAGRARTDSNGGYRVYMARPIASIRNGVKRPAPRGQPRLFPRVPNADEAADGPVRVNAF